MQSLTRGLYATTIAVGLLVASTASAATECRMDFRLEGWSAFYKTSHGYGTISCDHGQSARVALRTKGGGFTFGKAKIANGHGKFTPVEDISELFGDYANAEAEAGAGPSSDAQVVTKGTVSLAFSGSGTGVDLGFSFGKFTITKIVPRHRQRRRHHRRAY